MTSPVSCVQLSGLSAVTVRPKTGAFFSIASTIPYKYTGRFIMFSVFTNIYNEKTEGPNLMELFTATGTLKKFFF